jgi:hypothetical protein
MQRMVLGPNIFYQENQTLNFNWQGKKGQYGNSDSFFFGRIVSA